MHPHHHPWLVAHSAVCPACFLRSFAGVLSSSHSTKVLGLSSQEFSRGEPLSSVEAPGNVKSTALPMMNGENYGNTQRPQQNQVYVCRRSLGSAVTNGGSASNELAM